jgi:hypothetical protein
MYSKGFVAESMVVADNTTDHWPDPQGSRPRRKGGQASLFKETKLQGHQENLPQGGAKPPRLAEDL